MKLGRLLLAFFTGCMISIIVAELLLRELPVTMGLYRTRITEKWPLQAYGKHQDFSYSMTWQMLHPHRGKTNNYGQHAPFDYIPSSKPIVVIGDSFIEALMLSYENTLQGELGRLVGPSLPVYGLGFSGNSLAEYLAVAKMAKDEFSPVAMVFLIIDNDIAESWSNRAGHHYFSIESSSVTEAYLPLNTIGMTQKIREAVGDSALYRYIQVNLGFSIDNALARRKSSNNIISQQNSPDIEIRSRRAVDHFLERLPLVSDVAPRNLILIFDSDRDKIYDPLRSSRQGVDSMDIQLYMKSRAASLGFSIIDTKAIFENHYHLQHRRFDFTPVDRHWNELAHKLIASEALKIVSVNLKK